MPNLIDISRYCIATTITIIVSGLVSYLTANGHAVIGPDPASVETQKIAIAVGTLRWAGSFGAVAVFAFVMGKKRNNG